LSVKVKVGQPHKLRVVASGEKRPVIVPDSITLGIDTVGQYIARIDGGQGIIVFPESDIESANIVISHANTSTEVSSNNGGLEFVSNVDIDNFGHITALHNTQLATSSFTANSTVITPNDITFGTTSLTLGESTNTLDGISLTGVPQISGVISGANNTIDFNATRITNIADAVNDQDSVNKRFLDTAIAGVEEKFKVVEDPILPTDAANKRYVDNFVQGFVVRGSAKAATTENLDATYYSGNTTFASTLTFTPRAVLYIDDVGIWEEGDNIVVKDQTDPRQNGSYDLIQKGSTGLPWVWQRAQFQDQNEEIPGSYEFVTDGTENAHTGWVITVADASTFRLNYDNITWEQFQGEGTFTAGRGLTLNGTQFVVDKIQDIEQISGNGAIILPVGTDGDRPTSSTGMIRFNTEANQFEGYDGIAWSGLGGVIDVDQDTYIKAESGPSQDEDTLYFYTKGTLAATLNAANTAHFYGNVDVDGDVTIGGRLTIGNQEVDEVQVVADFTSNLIPKTDLTYNLGKAGSQWNKMFIGQIGNDSRVVNFSDTGAIKVPTANTSLRPTPSAGMFRFNTDDGRFEGYDGTQWAGISGSVIDIDQDTKIIAETSPNADNDQLMFYTAGTKRWQINSDGDTVFGSTGKLIVDYTTGNLEVNSKITANNNLVLDPAGVISVANNTLTDLASPVNPGDAVNLGYLEGEFSSDLTIVDGANTYSTEVNLLNSPTLQMGTGLEIEEISQANNSFTIGIENSGVQAGIYGNDNFVPRIRITEDGRIDFATDIPVELQANAIPNFTETTRDIIGLMISDGMANNMNEGAYLVNDDLNNQLYIEVEDPYISLGGDLSGSGQMINLSNTTINATITADYISNVVTDANSGIIITHTAGPDSNSEIEVDYAELNTRYITTSGGTSNGDIYAPKFVDADNNLFYLDPAGTSKLNRVDFGTGTSAQIRMLDGPGSYTTLYSGSGKIGFLDNTYNFGMYFERSTRNLWISNNITAASLIDISDNTKIVNPSGTSTIWNIEVENRFEAGGLQIGGGIGNNKIRGASLTLEGTSGNITLAPSTNIVDVDNSKIINLATPTATNDAATKAYVDGVAQGLRVIPQAIAGTTEDLGGSYNTGTGTITASANGAFEVDDVTNISVGDLILVKDQTALFENGTYEVTTVGDTNTPWVLTRSEYFNETSEIPGSFQFITDGTENGSTGWVITVSDAETFTLGTDSIVWYQFSGAGTYTAGEALTLTGTEFSITDGDIENAKLANPNITIAGESGNNQVIALGSTLTFEAGEGVDTTISAGKVNIAVNELDGGTF